MLDVIISLRHVSVSLLSHQAYSKPSIVLTNCLPIESATCTQQGDQLVLLLLAHVFDDNARSVKSLVRHLDDDTISDDEDTNPNGSCLFAAGSPTDTFGSQNFLTFSTRQISFLVAKRPMPAMLLRLSASVCRRYRSLPH